MFINWKMRQIEFKLVYYGAALSGKTTNLEYIYAHIDPHARSDFVSLKTREDRTIFFDFLQIQLGEIKGLKPKFNLYTVPGQVFYLASRKLVLQGADGVVFVVDSRPNRLLENAEAWNNLQANLRALSRDHANFPILLQYNKRDLPNALPIETLRINLALKEYPQIEAIAVIGVGVFETLKSLIRTVMTKTQHELS